MDNRLISIKIPDGFRAIRCADIAINGITVVAGINGCGKSTLSKLLYFTYKDSIQYETLFLSSIHNRLKPYYDVLNLLFSQLRALNIEQPRRALHPWRTLRNLSKADEYLKDVAELCRSFIGKETAAQEEESTLMTDRIWKILWSALGDEDNHPDLRESLRLLQQQMSKIIKDAQLASLKRPKHVLTERLNSQLKGEVPQSVSVSEYGDAFIGGQTDSVPIPHYIQRVAYIDTPMILGIDTLFEGPDYWDDLNRILKSSPVTAKNDIVRDTLKNDILHGEAVYDEDALDDAIKFRREDGQVFDLLDCATGIKSFSILQLMLKNGFLQKDTLLIIDEPEAHLHPQWIVEYARLILLLNKHVGVKFFIASHSTDMVGALKEIAPTVGVDALDFYVAEQTDNIQYNYKSLGTDVDPIFASFNKSYERLDLYASAERE